MLFGGAASGLGELLCQAKAEPRGRLCFDDDALGAALACGGKDRGRRGEAGEDWGWSIGWDGLGIC